MGTILLCNGSGAFILGSILVWVRALNVYVEQSDAATYGVGSVDSLISNFSNHGSLHTIPGTGPLVEGLSKSVYTSDSTAPL